MELDRRAQIEDMARQAMAELTDAGGGLNPDTPALERGWAALRDLFARTEIPFSEASVLGAQVVTYFMACQMEGFVRQYGDDHGSALGASYGTLLATVHALGQVYAAEMATGEARELLDGLDLQAGEPS